MGVLCLLTVHHAIFAQVQAERRIRTGGSSETGRDVFPVVGEKCATGLAFTDPIETMPSLPHAAMGAEVRQVGSVKRRAILAQRGERGRGQVLRTVGPCQIRARAYVTMGGDPQGTIEEVIGKLFKFGHRSLCVSVAWGGGCCFVLSSWPIAHSQGRTGRYYRCDRY